MSNYVGPGKELLSSELPTVRDILRFGVRKRELSDQDRRHVEVDQLVETMVTAVQENWQRANDLFKPPITNDPRTLHLKLRDLWNKAVRVSLGQGKLKDKERFTEKLDKLVDILNCKYKILICSEFDC